MPVKKQSQKQKQRQSVVIHIGDKYAKRKRAARRRQKKPAAAAVEPVIVPFTRVPPIWVQQPEPMRPFASNETAKPMSLAAAAVNAPAPSTAPAPVPVPPTPAPPAEPEVKIRKPFTKYMQPSYQTGFATESEEETPFPKKAAPAVEKPMSLTKQLEQAESEYNMKMAKEGNPRSLRNLRKIPEEQWTAEERARIEKANAKNVKEKGQRAAARWVEGVTSQPESIGVTAIRTPTSEPAPAPEYVTVQSKGGGGKKKQP